MLAPHAVTATLDEYSNTTKNTLAGDDPKDAEAVIVSPGKI
tara:strand:+ start:898 stop:1020 length:123 start_codon:yes stop_codon:yes gene_type:complete